MRPDPPGTSAGAGFGAEHLRCKLAALPTPQKYWVGFSGGADSTALLQALYESRADLPCAFAALHFHHGLLEEAGTWLERCRAFCEERRIAFRSERLEIDRTAGTSPEEAARDARYRAVARILGENEMFLTAHQAEDLAETLFLNLMRGSGIEGLAGIPPLRRLGPGWVARPLLEVGRADLVAFLSARGIDWLTDPSNVDTQFDRNYIRHALFPVLEMRWTGVVGRLSRVARNARITSDAMAAFVEEQAGDLMRDALKLPVQPLLELEPAMQSLVLRQWLRRHEIPPLPEARLLELLDQVARSDSESQAEVRWGAWMIKHYRMALWLHRREPYRDCPEIAWREGARLPLGPETGTLLLHGDPVPVPRGWRVRPRRPGDCIRPQRYASSQKIKLLFQSASVPPWLRSCIPVLEWNGEPVALGDWALAPCLQDWLAENGLEYRWEPSDPVLERIRQDCHH